MLVVMHQTQLFGKLLLHRSDSTSGILRHNSYAGAVGLHSHSQMDMQASNIGGVEQPVHP